MKCNAPSLPHQKNNNNHTTTKLTLVGIFIFRDFYRIFFFFYKCQQDDAVQWGVKKRKKQKYIFGEEERHKVLITGMTRKTSKWGQRKLHLQNAKGGEASKEPNLSKTKRKGISI